MIETQFQWIPFFQEFADKLLRYKDNRLAMITKVRQMFKMTGINMPLLEADNQIEDMDPFTVFGLFNKGLTDANRTATLRAFKELFEINASVPTMFDGIPVLNNLKATFYWFKREEENEKFTITREHQKSIHDCDFQAMLKILYYRPAYAQKILGFFG